jgi:hypothetical protein
MEDDFVPDYTDSHDDEADIFEREEELRQRLDGERQLTETGQTLSLADARTPRIPVSPSIPFSSPLAPRPVAETLDRTMRDQTHRSYTSRVGSLPSLTRRPSPTRS